MLNFDFLTSKFQNDENDASSFVDFDQANDYLNLIGLQSGSTAINLLTTALIFLILPIIHILVGLYYLYIKKNSNHRNWWLILFKKLFDSLTFGVYIRTLFEAYVFMMLSSSSEIFNYSKDNVQMRRSIGFAWAIFILCLSMICLAMWQWIKSLKSENLESMYFFLELFSGIKNSKRARFYSFMFLIRRFLFWFLVIFSAQAFSVFLRSLFYSIIQISYFLFVVLYRPFEEFKDNFLEIFNEVVYSSMWIMLIFLPYENNWNSFTENTFLYLMITEYFWYKIEFN